MIELSAHEARILGVLIEKAKTTPDQYPLSINGLTTGCNQKTNREPVLNLSDSEVQDIIDSLSKKQLISEVRAGGRIPKYKHRLYGTEFSEYKFNDQHQAIICLLFLRGPQTAGELRTRSARLCTFHDVQHTERALQELAEMPGGPFTVQLPKEPGRRESRYMHLFCGQAAIDNIAPATVVNSEQSTPKSNPELEERIELLEAMVEELETRLTTLEKRT